MVNDAWKTSMGTGRRFRVKANHAVFPPPRNIWTRVKQDSNGCQVQPRRADQVLHVSTSRPVPPCGQEIHAATQEGESLGLSTDLCTHSQGPKTEIYLQVITPCPGKALLSRGHLCSLAKHYSVQVSSNLGFQNPKPWVHILYDFNINLICLWRQINRTLIKTRIICKNHLTVQSGWHKKLTITRVSGVIWCSPSAKAWLPATIRRQ